MKAAQVTVEMSFENLTSDDAPDIDVVFEYDVAAWTESVPYGSTYASMPCGEAECTAIFVPGNDTSIDEDELVRITGGGFDKEKDWERVDNKAWEIYDQ